ncbi:hypothetical protein [Frigoribacterium sp. NBH87]|uniref:hypothetical protein n=1 Tax=Frigoribacterium sp. NBH87 TaxID=2596916 RepID=UPI00162324B6|nr:hypothetical protein [Frigoribacterium sp. NBH87]
MSTNTTPEDTNPWAAAINAGPVRDAEGRFVYDPTYNPEDGDKFDDDTHLAGLDDEAS